MERLWTLKGISFGYREGDSLFTYDGLEIGRFHGEEIFGPNGGYLGEVRNQNRLIVCLRKQSHRKSAFTPRRGPSYAGTANTAGNPGQPGCENFPGPEHFKGGMDEE